MADLITLDDLEHEIEGFDPDESGEAADRYLYFIHKASTFVKSYTGIAYPVEEVESRIRADYYGVIELPEDTQTVESVVPVHGGAFDWHWDGLDEIYNLPPRAVVDVKITRGYEDVPDELKLVTASAVRRLGESVDNQDARPVALYTVGDVVEKYDTGDGVAGFFTEMDRIILDEYRITERSFRMGWRADDSQFSALPASNDEALFE